jgi:hypothetical protein
VVYFSAYAFSTAQTGDNVMPGNFYPELEINDHGCLTPAGPMKLEKGETVLRLDAWIWQDESACMSVQRVFPEKTSWKITTDPHEDHVGPGFKPGAAVAMALMVVETANGETETYHWTDSVFLYENGMKLQNLLSAAKSSTMV